MAVVASSTAIPKCSASEIFAGLATLDRTHIEPFILSLHAAFTTSVLITALAVSPLWSRLRRR
ncbi:hypothetical protein [Thermoproteus tenax]|uniref:hypothetical protein n=1 Tax=Thermoproteus tenax TaxID=2271 RepID=UPI001433299C|nr:hypothetical protein [Thermoproteus tenax]